MSSRQVNREHTTRSYGLRLKPDSEFAPLTVVSQSGANRSPFVIGDSRGTSLATSERRPAALREVLVVVYSRGRRVLQCTLNLGLTGTQVSLRLALSRAPPICQR